MDNCQKEKLESAKELKIEGLTPAEQRQLEMAAARQGVTVEGLLRQIIRQLIAVKKNPDTGKQAGKSQKNQ